MIEISTKDLSSGMRIAKNIHYYDFKNSISIEIPKGHYLDDNDIQRLNNAKIETIFVDKFPKKFKIKTIISKKIKEESLKDINAIAENFKNDVVDKKNFSTLQETSSELITALTDNDSTMINILDLKRYDDYTFHHSLSVCVMSLAIGTELKFNDTQLNDLAMASLLHDIGKVSIPIEILNKPSKLTAEEQEIMHRHPVDAAKYLIKNKLVNQDVFSAILCHHEKWDGTGYPNGLEGTDIPIYARIISVADVYDALTSNRPYRAPSEPTEAMEYIMGACGVYFDIDIVKAFLRKVTPYPIGSKVKLSNNQVGYVVSNNPSQPLRPQISVENTDDIYDLFNDESKQNIILEKKLYK